MNKRKKQNTKVFLASITALTLILFSIVYVNAASNPNLGLAAYINQNWTRRGPVITESMIADAGAGWNSYNVSMGAQEASVLFENGVFKMWFVTTPASVIGYATSANGVTWSIRSSPVLTTPILHTYVYKVNSTYFLYGKPSEEQISVYSSSDGLSWALVNASCLMPGVWDAYFGNVAVLKDASTHYMFYEAKNTTTTPWVIGLATSPDGVVWTKYVNNPVISNLIDPDRHSTGGPFVTFENDGKWYMWVHKANGLEPWVDTPTDLFIYESDDLYTWTLYPSSSPILTRLGTDEGEGQNWGQIADPAPVTVAGNTYLYYTATADQNSFTIKLAVFYNQNSQGIPLALNLLPLAIIIVGILMILYVVKSDLESIEKAVILVFAMMLIGTGFSVAITYISGI